MKEGLVTFECVVSAWEDIFGFVKSGGPREVTSMQSANSEDETAAMYAGQ